MNRIAQIFITILLIPTLIEAMDYTLPTISFGPFTIGRYSFVAAGLIALLGNKKFSKRNSKIFIGFLLVLIGNLIASTFFDTFQSVSRTIANLLLLVGARGIAYYLDTETGRKTAVTFFLVAFVYWIRYFSSLVLSGGTLGVYSDLFRTGEAVNHHVIGMILSISGVFTCTYYFFKDGIMKLYGYIGIVFTAAICFITESRSNTTFTILSIILLLLVQNRVKLTSLIRLSPVIILLYWLTGFLLAQNEVLSQRYDINDVEYQERTTSIRVDMVFEAFAEFVRHPLGKGLKNVEVTVDGRTHLIHNQYLSFMVGGGILSVIGIITWLTGIFGTFRKYIAPEMKDLKNIPYNTASILAVMMIHITLLTIEFSSLLLFIMLALGMLMEQRVESTLAFLTQQKRQKRYR